MRGIGIDLGLGPDPTAAMHCAFDHGAATPLGYWTIQPAGGAWPQRVARVAAALRDLLREQRPDFVTYAAPHLQYFKRKGSKARPADPSEPAQPNIQTLRKLAALEGALLLACADAGVLVVDVAEAQSKKALTGDHQAKKQQMVDAAWMYFRLEVTEHEADALGHLLAGETKVRELGLRARAAV